MKLWVLTFILFLSVSCTNSEKEVQNPNSEKSNMSTTQLMDELRRRYLMMIGRTLEQNIRGYNLYDTLNHTSWKKFSIKNENVDTACYYYVITLLSGDLLCFEANRLAFVVPLSENVPIDSIITKKDWQ